MRKPTIHLFSPLILLLLPLSMAGMLGCKEPSAIGRFRAVPVTNMILDSLGVVEEEPEVFAGARDPRPEDLQPSTKEYVITRGDIVMVTIFELFSEGIQWSDNIQVSDTGRITIPVVGTLRAADLTELEFSDVIVGELSPTIISDPKVGVVVVNSVEKTFSISGAVAAPGQYQLFQHDFRMLKALALSGGIPAFGTDYAYVIRTLKDQKPIEPGGQPLRESEMSLENEGLLPPMPWMVEPSEEEPAAESEEVTSKPQEPGKGSPTEQLEEDEESELLKSIAPMGVFESPRKKDQTENADESESEKPFKIIRSDGQWKLEPTERLKSPRDVVPEALPRQKTIETGPGWGFEELGTTGLGQEVIRIDLKKLRGGDLSRNIVIRPGDDIHIPQNIAGVYYVQGQVARAGAYNLTAGQKMTLKQAMAAGGPLTSLAWPSRCEIIRRIGENMETTALIDLEKVYEGTAPDIFIKPGDIINVGSHPVARWVAVIRESFRSTYGFGFVYDRNFADKDFGR